MDSVKFYGIKCKNCDYKIFFETKNCILYIYFLNKTCPKCKTKLITIEDYKLMRNLQQQTKK